MARAAATRSRTARDGAPCTSRECSSRFWRPDERTSPTGGVAAAAVRRVEGHARHAAPVDADGREDAARAGADDEPLVAGDPLPHGAGSHHLADARRAEDRGDRVRLPRSRAGGAHERRREPEDASRPALGGGFPPGVPTLLRSLDVEAKIWPVPVEMPEAVPFTDDVVHASYDAGAAHRCFRVLAQADRVLKEFRGGFLGKCSPVHFWWGGFDLSCTRFSGPRAPPHPGGLPNLADRVMREAYSHECISAGWWPGGGVLRARTCSAYARSATGRR